MIENNIPTVVYKVIQTGVKYPFAWTMLKSSLVKVVLEGVALLENVDYTLSALTDQGGEISLIIPANIGDDLTITRDTPINQQLTYDAGSVFNVRSLESQLDKTVMNIQEVDAQVRPILIGLSNRMITVEQDLKTLLLDHTKVDASIVKLTDRMVVVEAAVVNLVKDDVAMKKSFDAYVTSNDHRVATIEHDVSIIFMEAQDTKLILTGVDSRLHTVEGWRAGVVDPKMTTHDNDIKVLLPEQSKQRTDIGGLDVRLTAIEAGNAPPSNLQPIYDKLTVHDTKIGTLESTALHHGATIASNTSASNANSVAIANADLQQMRTDIDANAAEATSNKSSIGVNTTKTTDNHDSIEAIELKMVSMVNNTENNRLTLRAHTNYIGTNQADINKLKKLAHTTDGGFVSMDYLQHNGGGAKTDLSTKHLDSFLTDPVTNEGLWYQASSAQATTANGYPSDGAGGLLRVSYMGGHCMMTWQGTDTRTSNRVGSISGGTWLPWTDSQSSKLRTCVGKPDLILPIGMSDITGTTTAPINIGFPDSTYPQPDNLYSTVSLTLATGYFDVIIVTAQMDYGVNNCVTYVVDRTAPATHQVSRISQFTGLRLEELLVAGQLVQTKTGETRALPRLVHGIIY